MPRTALDHFTALPKRYQHAGLVALARGREQAKDHWPHMAIIRATAKEFGVDKEKLAAMFGIVTLAVSNARTHVTYDAMRNGEPPLYLWYDPKLRPFYDFFRAFVAQDAEPLHRRPLAYGEGTYLPRDKERRVKAAYERFHARADAAPAMH